MSPARPPEGAHTAARQREGEYAQGASERIEFVHSFGVIYEEDPDQDDASPSGDDCAVRAANETVVGGKAKSKHKGPGGRGDNHGRGGKGKAIFIGAVQRKGNVAARVIEAVDGATLVRFVREAVSHRVSLGAADEFPGYSKLACEFPHGLVNHDRDEYVNGFVHTNTMEGFWSLVKRGMVGTFHMVSKTCLPLYVNEFQFRCNDRKSPDIFRAAVRAAALPTC